MRNIFQTTLVLNTYLRLLLIFGPNLIEFLMPLRLLCIIVTLFAPFAAQSQEAQIPPEARKVLELTIYESDLALVKDQRDFKLPTAQSTLAFLGVSGQIQPETVLFRLLGPEPFQVIEQVFDSNVLSPQSVLQRSVGRDVSVFTPNPATGKDTVERAKVLSVDQGLVLEIGGKIHTQVPGRIVFDTLPEGLRVSPTLLMTVKGPVAKDLRAELSYLTSGLSWRTNYVADFDADEKRLDLTGWATITNATGVDFKDTKVKLISGDINRSAPSPQIKTMARRGGPEVAMAMAAPADGIQQQSLGSYHLYNIEKPLSLENNRTKQIALLGGKGVAVKQEYIVRGEPYFYQQQMPERPPVTQAESAITLKNDKAVGLGLPLPAGVVRVYGQDETGAPQFLGESALNHTAEGGDVRIVVGRDFDVTSEREQKNFVRAGERIVLTTWRVSLKNAKTKPVSVRVVEPFDGAWEITRETQAHDKANARMAEWTITVPAKGQADLEYTARIQN